MFVASPIQGSDADFEPDSKISGLLWGVPFPTIVLSYWAELVLVSSLLYVLISRTCQTEGRCALFTESGLRMDPLNLVLYLPRAEWSLGPEDPGCRAMLCQVLKEHQMCPRRCVVSLLCMSEMLAWALNRCMELCLSVMCFAGWIYLHPAPPWLWERGRWDIAVLVCFLLAVSASVTAPAATFSFFVSKLWFGVVLTSAVQQSDSVIYILLHILFHHVLSQDIEHSFLCHTSRTLLLSHSIYSSLHLFPNSQPSPPPPLLPLGNHKSVLYVWVVSVL